MKRYKDNKRWWLLSILLFSFVALGAADKIEWNNLVLKNNLSVAGTTTLTGAGTMGGVSLLSQTNTVTGITNKTFTSPTLTTPNVDIETWDGQGSAPSNPSAGFFKIWVDDTTGKPKIVNSSGTVSSLGGGGGGSSGINMLSDYNRDAESGTTYWSETGGGTLTTTTTAADVANGTAAFSYNCSANADYVESDSRTIPAGLYGKNCLAEAYLKGFDTSATLQVTDGSTVLNSVVLAAQTTYQKYQLNFPCPSSGSLKFKILCTGDAAIGYFDEVHLGSATNIGEAYTRTYLGALTTVGTWTTGATYAGKYWREGDFLVAQVVVTASGAVTATGLNLTLPSSLTIDTAKLGLTTNAMKLDGGIRCDNPGDNVYEGFVAYNSTTAISTWRPITKDGNALSELYTGNQFTNSAPFTIGASDTCSIWYRVPISGWAAESAVKADNADFNWTSFTPTGSWSTNSTYYGMYRRVGDSMEIQYKVSLGGAPTAADLQFNMPTGFTIDTTKLANAAANEGSFGSVIIEDSATRQYIGGIQYASTSTFTVSHSESGNNGFVNATNPITFASGDSVSAMVKVPITGWTNNQRVPLLVGSVTSGTLGLERIERATGTCSASSSIGSQSGTWVSSGNATDNGSNRQCTLTITSGLYSATPTCVTSGATSPGAGATIAVMAVPASSTSVVVYGADADYNYSIMCMGPR